MIGYCEAEDDGEEKRIELYTINGKPTWLCQQHRP